MPKSVGSVRDLVDAVSSGKLAELFPTMDRRLPQMVAASSWSVRLSEHYLLLYHRDMEATEVFDQEAFLAESEQIRTEIIAYFGSLWSSKECQSTLKRHLTVMLLHTRSRRKFGTLVKPDFLLYLLDPRQDPDYMVEIRHEYAHWVWGAMYGEAPAVFNEGLAVVVETMSRRGKTEADLLRGLQPLDRVPALHDLCTNNRFFEHVTGYYRIAGTFVHFLSSRWGWMLVAKLFKRTDYEDPTVADTFAQVFGISLPETDAAWRDCLRLKSRESSG
jgi:hypothetical protein